MMKMRSATQMRSRRRKKSKEKILFHSSANYVKDIYGWDNGDSGAKEFEVGNKSANSFY